MNRVVRFTSIAFVALICIIFPLFSIMQPTLTMPKSAIESPSPVNVAQKVDFGRHFQDLGVEGSIIIYDSNNAALKI